MLKLYLISIVISAIVMYVYIRSLCIFGYNRQDITESGLRYILKSIPIGVIFLSCIPAVNLILSFFILVMPVTETTYQKFIKNAQTVQAEMEK